MPMELLFVLAQSQLPMTVDASADVDKLRVLAAAQLVDARLPEVGTPRRTAEVLAISPQGRAALAKVYPHHTFPDPGPRPSAAPDWPASEETYRMERDASKTTLDS